MKKKLTINRNKQNALKSLTGITPEYIFKVNNRAMRRLKGERKGK